jgi:hypothetical protein
MLVVIDQILNANPNATVIVHGARIPWFDLPGLIAREGEARAYQSFYRGDSRQVGVIVTPPLSPDVPAPPSTVAARTLLRGMWPEVQLIAPSFPDGPSYKWGYCIVAPALNVQGRTHQHFNACFMTTIHDDGSILFTAVQLVAYRRIVKGVIRRGTGGNVVPVSDTHFLADLNLFNPQKPNDNFNFALRISNWRPQAPLNYDDLTTGMTRISQGLFPDYPPVPSDDNFPASFGQRKSQTILLRDQSPLRVVSVGSDWPAPPSPVLHLDIVVGDAVTILPRGIFDFRAAEIRYEKEQEAWAARNSAWRSLQFLSTFVLKATLAIAGELGVPSWLTLPYEYLFDEFERDIT